MRESAKHLAEDQLRESVLTELTFFETAVVERFYGLLDGSEAMTISEIAEDLKVERAQVLRARSAALRKLKASETVKQARLDIAGSRRRLIA